MSELIIWTCYWVPEGPCGFVRDMRLRWACEEAGLAYSVRTVLSNDRGPDHLARQPFGQVPFLSDGALEIFESGAGLLHLARKSEKLMPRNSVGEAQTLQWTISALNSIEMVSVPWWFLEVTGAKENGLTGWLESRLAHMECVLTEREWLAADRFTVADLLMADVLRVARVRVFGNRPATESYVRASRSVPHSRRPMPIRWRILQRVTQFNRCAAEPALRSLLGPIVASAMLVILQVTSHCWT